MCWRRLSRRWEPMGSMTMASTLPSTTSSPLDSWLGNPVHEVVSQDIVTLHQDVAVFWGDIRQYRCMRHKIQLYLTVWWELAKPLDLCPMWESRIDGLGLRRYSAHVKSQREAAMQQAGSSSAASSGQPTLPKGSRGVTQSYGAGHPVPKAEV